MDKKTRKESNKNRNEIAEMEMVPTRLLTMALLLTKTDKNIPDTLKECQKSFKDMRRVFLSCMSSHLIAHARLDIADEKRKALKEEIKTLKKQLDGFELKARMKKQMQEKEVS